MLFCLADLYLKQPTYTNWRLSHSSLKADLTSQVPGIKHADFFFFLPPPLLSLFLLADCPLLMSKQNLALKQQFPENVHTTVSSHVRKWAVHLLQKPIQSDTEFQKDSSF